MPDTSWWTPAGRTFSPLHRDSGYDQVMTITTRIGDHTVIVPICPATQTLRAYAQGEREGVGEMVAELSVEVDDDGWATPEAIADAMWGTNSAPQRTSRPRHSPSDTVTNR